MKIRSGVSDQGRIIFWKYDVYFAGERGAEQFYNIPHHREVSHGSSYGSNRVHPLNTGAWRAIGNNTNTFARESHIDGMAAKLAVDPLEFRMKNLKDKRMARVLNTAAEKFGWAKSKAPSGRGQGVACALDAGTLCRHHGGSGSG